MSARPFELQGHNPVLSGNVSVNVKRLQDGKWNIHVGVFGNPDRCGMRPGRSADIDPGRFATAKDLRDGVGLLAATLAKQLDDTVDESDAHKGAVALLDECMVEMRKRGLA